jgi:RNA polymerase sigma-70 factor (ECF subfamily)
VDAEDLVQEVILRFMEEFGGKTQLPVVPAGEAWLVTTLSHLFYDQCSRARTRVNGAQDPALSAEAREAAPLPASGAITSEQFSEARSALSPKLRETYELYAAGKKYEDIARLLGIPVGTVKKRLHDARAQLRERLQTFLTPGPR